MLFAQESKLNFHSPFLKQKQDLICSRDSSWGTIRIWSQNKKRSLATFQQASRKVLSDQYSPRDVSPTSCIGQTHTVLLLFFFLINRLTSGQGT